MQLLSAAALTCSQRHDGHGRAGTLGVLTDVVETRERPAHGAVAAAHQNAEVRYVAEHVQPAQTATSCLQFMHIGNGIACVFDTRMA